MRLGRAAALTALGLLGLACVVAAAAYAFFRASLPTLDGSLTVAGLDGAVSIERDGNGVPTIRAQNRADLAFAVGFVHAQDRYFQMDLLRRAGSGELAALLGPRLLPVDRERRLHRFAARARAVVAAATADDKRFIERYTEGVNAGLTSLGARPFEYAVLRTLPAPWRPEDTVLVLYAMYFDLQEDQLHRVYARGWLRDHGSSAEQLAFLLPTATAYDAPLDAAAIDEAQAPLPASAPPWFGKPLPTKSARAGHGDDAASPRLALAGLPGDEADAGAPADIVIGSNNWAIGGSRTRSGAAIVSDDMHLGLRLPHIWQRLFAEVAAPPGGVPAAWRAGGVMIPGAPAFVAGSNGHIAWGMTNSYGQYLDLIEVELDASDPSRYRSGAGWAPLRFFDERIEVSGGGAETLRVAETEWGPLWQRGGRHYAVRWVAHAGSAVNFRLRDVEQASDVEQALRIAQEAGLPTQNIVVGDSGGHIGWTLAGPLLARVNAWANTFPTPPAAAASATWAIAAAASHPTQVDPPSGQLWTANARQLAGADYARIGDGGADLGARGQQARDGLSRLGSDVVEAGVYGVVLDDRALFLAPWRERALRALAEDRSGSAPRAEFARLLQSTWSGRASTESVAYRLTRAYYNALYRQLFGSVDEAMRAEDKGASYSRASQRWPAVVARLLDEQPQGWLPPGRASWQEVQLAAIDDAIAEATTGGVALAQSTWGRRNTAHIAHPLAASLPWGARWLAAPADALPGDNHMPRVGAPEFGQSERLVVAPGHEADAIFNMPGGESGHPLSPYFLAGHADWVNVRPSGFVPQERAHLLTLQPLTRP